jgi:hypothetical protein
MNWIFLQTFLTYFGWRNRFDSHLCVVCASCLDCAFSTELGIAFCLEACCTARALSELIIGFVFAVGVSLESLSRPPTSKLKRASLLFLGFGQVCLQATNYSQQLLVLDHY